MKPALTQRSQHLLVLGMADCKSVIGGSTPPAASQLWEWVFPASRSEPVSSSGVTLEPGFLPRLLEDPSRAQRYHLSDRTGEPLDCQEAHLTNALGHFR